MGRKPLPPDQKLASIAARRAYKTAWQRTARAVAVAVTEPRPKGCNKARISEDQVLAVASRYCKPGGKPPLTKAAVHKLASKPTGVLSLANRARKSTTDMRKKIFDATATVGANTSVGTLGAKVERGVKRRVKLMTAAAGGAAPSSQAVGEVELSQRVLAVAREEKKASAPHRKKAAKKK